MYCPASETRTPRITSHCNDAAPKSHPSSCESPSPYHTVSICNRLWDIHAIDHLFAWINISLTLGSPPSIRPIAFDKTIPCRLYSGWRDHRPSFPPDGWCPDEWLLHKLLSWEQSPQNSVKPTQQLSRQEGDMAWKAKVQRTPAEKSLVQCSNLTDEETEG